MNSLILLILMAKLKYRSPMNPFISPTLLSHKVQGNITVLIMSGSLETKILNKMKCTFTCQVDDTFYILF